VEIFCVYFGVKSGSSLAAKGRDGARYWRLNEASLDFVGY
jgi:hypothetical protein